jgi:hypothetical protein
LALQRLLTGCPWFPLFGVEGSCSRYWNIKEHYSFAWSGLACWVFIIIFLTALMERVMQVM